MASPYRITSDHTTPHLATAAVLLLGLAALLAWDFSGNDLTLARLWGSPAGFAWRDQPAFVFWLHEVPRCGSWAVVLWLWVGVLWPTGVQRRLPRTRRLWWAGVTLLSVLLISVIKNRSHTSCPWDLAEFGGVARHVSHWALGVADGGSGRCFPAGHATAGFAHLAGYFALRSHAPRAARWWLAGALLVGLSLGLAQQVRGAHYLSHTLWTAWLCAALAGACALMLRPRDRS